MKVGIWKWIVGFPGGLGDDQFDVALTKVSPPPDDPLFVGSSPLAPEDPIGFAPRQRGAPALHYKVKGQWNGESSWRGAFSDAISNDSLDPMPIEIMLGGFLIGIDPRRLQFCL